MTFDELNIALTKIKAWEQSRGAKMFNGIPERWMDSPGPFYRCPNDHVSTTLLNRSKGPKDTCLECFKPVCMTFPEDDTDGPLEHEALK